MEKSRAEQILVSPERIKVVYEGSPVWIEGVNENTVNVSFIGSCKTMDIPFDRLEEKGPLK